MTQTTQRFTSVEQAAIFTVGRLEGLANTTRWTNRELAKVVRDEINEIAQTLKQELLK